MFVVWLWIKDSVKGLFRNFGWNFTSFFLAALSLLFFMSANIVGMNMESFSQTLNQKVEIDVDLLNTVTNVQALETKVQQLAGVKSVTYVDQAQAYAQVAKEMGSEASVLKTLNTNPFPARLVIHVQAADQAAPVASQIQTWGVASSIQYGQSYVSKLMSITLIIRNIGYILSAIAAFFTVFIVMTAIRINISQRNLEIEIKQLVGASTLTIRIPFVIEALILTGAASYVVYRAVVYGYSFLLDSAQKSIPYLPLDSTTTIQQGTFLPIMVMALSIGFLGSAWSTKKYIKKY